MYVSGLGINFSASVTADPRGVSTTYNGPQLPTSPSSPVATPVQQSNQPYVSPGEGGGLIVDDEPAPVPTAAKPRYTTGCNAPSNVCFADPVFGQTVRRAMQGGCAAQLPASVRYQVRGLGGVDCGRPPASSITPQNTTVFFQQYGPCVLKDIPDCGGGGGGRGLTIEMEDWTPFDPGGFQTLDTPPEEKDDDNSSYMIGGLLALLAVGGLAYAATRKKKKGKKK